MLSTGLAGRRRPWEQDETDCGQICLVFCISASSVFALVGQVVACLLYRFGTFGGDPHEHWQCLP